jgi:hypothetical protein
MFAVLNYFKTTKQQTIMKRTLLAIAVLGTAALTVSAQDNNTDNHKVKFVIPEIALLDLKLMEMR